MDVRSLTTFVAAFEEKSFSRAAQRLNATQPGVSVQISILEAELGSRLFERNARGVEPTMAGNRLYEKALRIIHDLRSAEVEIKSLSGVVSGQLAVGIPPTLSKAVLAPVLSQYIASFPHVDIRVLEAYSDTLISLIENDKLDFAFVGQLADHPAITYEAIFQDQFILVSSIRLGLKARLPIRLDKEPRFNLVVPSVLRHGLSRLLEEPIRMGRINPYRIMELDGLAGALEFIATTDWVALLPSAIAYNHPDTGEVQFNPITEDIRIDYFVARARTKPLTVVAKHFIERTAKELTLVTAQWQAKLASQ